MIESMESSWDKPYDEIPREQQIDAEDRCWWPPWALNNIIGYVDVGMDSGVRLTGNVFLMRKYFPKDSWENRNRKYDLTAKKNEIVPFCELNPFYVHLQDNSSFIGGVESILTEAKDIIKTICKTKKYKWVIEKAPIPLKCIDFVKAFAELKSKSTKTPNQSLENRRA